MDSAKNNSNLRLFIHTLAPSFWSVLVGLLCAGIITGGHLLAISLRAGTILPQAPDSIWALGYTNYVVSPVLQITNSQAFSTGVAIAAWALAGLLAASLLQLVVRTIREWREAESDIKLTTTAIVRHPVRQEYVRRALWRLGSLLCFVTFVLFVRPAIGYLLGLDYRLFQGLPAAQTLGDIALIIICWCALVQVCVICLRLYTFRTRVFGELIR